MAGKSWSAYHAGYFRDNGYLKRYRDYEEFAALWHFPRSYFSFPPMGGDTMRAHKTTEKQIIWALYRSSGLISRAVQEIQAAYNIRVSYNAIFQRIQHSKRLQEAQEGARAQVADTAESVTVSELKKGNWRVAIRVLATLGKRRGYGCTGTVKRGGKAAPVIVAFTRKL